MLDLRAEHMQQNLSHLVNKDAKRIKADNSLSDFFDGHGWAQIIADGHLLQAAIKDILAVGPSYEVPSSTALGGSICERQHAADKDEDARILGLPGVSKFGATLMTDGATIALFV